MIESRDSGLPLHRQKGGVVRSLIVCNIVSLDGFYEGPGGNVMALNMDEAFDAYNLERISAAGTVLLGRTSFIGMSAYWSQVADAPPDPSNRALSDVNRETSRIYNRLPKVVVSDSYTVPAANPWHHTTTVVPRNDVQTWLKAERTHGEGDVLTFASRIMWNGLLREGLVDELHLMLGPEAVGGGTPVLDAPARFTLADVRRFDASDNVLLRYSIPSRSS